MQRVRTLAGAIDPVLSSELDLDDPVPVRAGNGFFPAVAFDGTNFLVVFAQGREVRGARVSPAGVLLDTWGFPIGTMRSDGRPAVAHDGASFVVVWDDDRTGTGNGYDVYVQRVSSAGAIVGGELSFPAPTGQRKRPVVASNGSGAVIVWQDVAPTGELSISAASISQAGVLGAPTTIAAANAAEPTIAFGGGTYLVTWYAFGTSSIHAARVDATATPQGPDVVLPRVSVWPYQSAVAFDGTNFLVVWSDHSNPTINFWDINGIRVSPAGALVGSAVQLTVTTAAQKLEPAVAFDGTSYLVTWREDPGCCSYDVRGVLVGTDGLPRGGEVTISSAPDYWLHPVVAFGGGSYLVTWHGGLARRVSTAGAVQGPDIVVITQPNQQRAPAASFDGTNYLAVWTDQRNGGSDIFATRLSRTGTVLDPSGIAVSVSGTWKSQPATAFDGTSFLVAWQEEGSILGARVSSSGAVLDRPPLPLFASDGGEWAFGAAVASGGDGALVVWNDGNAGIRGTRVTAGGEVVERPPLAISSPAATVSGYPAAAFGAGRYVVVWNDDRDGGADVHGTLVSPDGGVLVPSDFPVSSGAGSSPDPAIAAGAGTFLVVWRDRRSPDSSIHGVRLDADGGRLGDDAPFPSTPYAWDPVVAFGGAGFLVAWEQRPGADYEVWGARVAADGGLLDPAGWSLSTPATEEDEPTLAAGPPGQVLLLYESWTSLGGQRVRARIVGSPAAGGRCSAAADCATGFCVDGVCCDAACGGNDPLDCQACSVDAGAAADGTCGPVASGRTCDDGDACTRTDTCQAGSCTGANPVTCAAADACHLAGTCDPATGTCSSPTRPDGELCDDGDPCTRNDGCAAGQCAGASYVCAPGACQVSSVCDGNGGCVTAPAADGTACDGGTCRRGICRPRGPFGCGAASSSDASGWMVVAALAVITGLARRRPITGQRG